MLDFSSSAAGRSNRSHGVDALRGIAVVGMLIAHCARVVPAGRVGPALLYDVIVDLEPLVSACFLFLAGWSLASSRLRVSSEPEACLKRWYWRSLRRAALLYMLAVALFLAQHGLQYPDAVLSPDILSVIALATAVFGPLLSRSDSHLLAVVTVTLLVAAMLELTQVSVSGINAGPGGAVPLLAFAGFGAWWRKRTRFAGPVWRPLVLVCGLSLAALLLPGSVVTEHISVYSNSLHRPERVWFWNHSLKGTLIIAGPIALAFAGFARLGSGVRLGWVAPLVLIGRHALVVYVGHLLLLGAAVVWLTVPVGAAALIVCVITLVALFTFVASLLESLSTAAWWVWLTRYAGLRL